MSEPSWTFSSQISPSLSFVHPVAVGGTFVRGKQNSGRILNSADLVGGYGRHTSDDLAPKINYILVIGSTIGFKFFAFFAP